MYEFFFNFFYSLHKSCNTWGLLTISEHKARVIQAKRNIGTTRTPIKIRGNSKAILRYCIPHYRLSKQRKTRHNHKTYLH